MSKTLKCDQCQLMIINGVPCHETGCPNSHINPRTEKPYEKECRWCGQTFTPDEPEQVCCSIECLKSYWG